jgi:hypothetical protein
MSISPDLERTDDLISGETEPQRITHESQPEVFVLFASQEQTLKALKKACDIAKPMCAGIVVLAAEIVPYPLPLDRPSVRLEFIIRRFQKIAGQYPAKTEVRVYLCRDQLEALKRVLEPNSTVVIGTKKRWWPTREARLARKLRRGGHKVILEETEPNYARPLLSGNRLHFFRCIPGFHEKGRQAGGEQKCIT